MARLIPKKPEGIPPPAEIDFKVLNEPLETIATAELNLLEREKRAPSRYYALLNAILLISLQTYRAIRKLVARDPKYPAQAHMLTRPMIDAIFVVVVLAEDPEENTKKWWASAFRDVWVDYLRRRELDKGYPEWEPITEMLRRLAEDIANDLALNKQQREDPRAHVKMWPNPSRVVQAQSTWANEDTKKFLKLLHDTRYADSSQMSHLAMKGLSAGVLAADPEAQWDPGKLESDAAALGILFLLMLLSEIEAACQYGLAEKVKYIWTVLGNYSGEAKEYYDARYSVLLGSVK